MAVSVEVTPTVRVIGSASRVSVQGWSGSKVTAVVVIAEPDAAAMIAVPTVFDAVKTAVATPPVVVLVVVLVMGPLLRLPKLVVKVTTVDPTRLPC